MLASDFLSQSSTWDTVAGGYVTDTMEELRPYAEDALAFLDPSPDAVALDVACGPGTLTTLLAARAASVTAIDYSSLMVEELARQLALRKIQNVQAHVMDGQALKLPDNHFDLAASMFGLMFFPDVSAGLRELYRVLKPGGVAAVSAWAPAVEVQAMATLFGVLFVVAPELPKPEKQMLSPLQDPDLFQEELRRAGFERVEVHPLEHSFVYKDPQSAWESIERGSAPFAVLRKTLGEELWQSRRQDAIAYLKQSFARWPVEIGSRAWLCTGGKST